MEITESYGRPIGSGSNGRPHSRLGLRSPGEQGGDRAESPLPALHKAGQEFEAYFISYLIKNMRETVPKGLLDRKDEQVWYSFYDQEIAKLSTEAGGIGITAFVDAYAEKLP